MSLHPVFVPDFFLVGAPKCATSSLHLLLLQHPDIFMCRPKEPHFYSSDLPGLTEVADAAAYAALFANAPEGAMLGEASAFYLASRDAAANIHAANPEARIILSIRNPADAAFSWYHQLRDGFREDQTNFATSWALQEARAAGRDLPPYCPEPEQLQYRRIYSYHDQIALYFDLFGREAVKVLLFEEIRTEPRRVVADLLAFIGVPPFETHVSLPKTNTMRQSRYPWLTQLMAAPPPVLRPLTGPVKRGLNGLGIKPSEVMMKHMSRAATDLAQRLEGDLRHQVTRAFTEDVSRLETLLERDLSDWRE